MPTETPLTTGAALKRFFFNPPRKHGEVDHEREVSFLELFYDLVYVVTIGQASQNFATHLSWTGLLDFIVVFAMIWFAWFNGTVWHELHGREDGRSRTNIFIQMGLVVLMAVYTSHATSFEGAGFATVYALLFAWHTYQWYAVQRIDDPIYHPITRRYITGMVITVSVVAISAFTPENYRVLIWGGVVLFWLFTGLFGYSRSTSQENGELHETAGFHSGLTDSLVERFGLLIIVVLGEVVIGVVGGLSEVEDRTAMTILVAMLGLGVGMGLWWNYFDSLGSRVPSESGMRLATWIYIHLPIAVSISAAGAAMVSLVEYSSEARTPTPIAWVMAGAVAVALICIGQATRALDPQNYPGDLLARIPITMAVGAAACITIAAIRPAPAVFAGLLFTALAATWLSLVVRFLAADAAERRAELAAAVDE